MPTYRVTLATVAHHTREIEADDEETAVDIAYEDAPSLCSHCAGWNQPGIELGEWGIDGFTLSDVGAVELDADGNEVTS